MCPKPLAPFQPLSSPMARAERTPQVQAGHPGPLSSLLARCPWHKPTAFARSLACHLSSVSRADRSQVPALLSTP